MLHIKRGLKNNRVMFLIASIVAISEFAILTIESFLPSIPQLVVNIADTITLAIVTAVVVHKYVVRPQEMLTKRTSQAILSNMFEGVILQSKENGVEEFNSAALRILGITADQLMGRSTMDPRWRAIKDDGSIFNNEEHPALVALRTELAQTNTTLGVVHKNGEIHWLKINANPVYTGGTMKVVVTFTDITQEKELAKDVTYLNDRLKLAVKSVGFGVWDWNLKSGAMDWDEFMFDLFEIKKADFENHADAFKACLDPIDYLEHQKRFQQIFEAQKQYFKMDFKITTLHKKVKYISAQANCFYDIDGKIERVVGCCWDVTESIQRQHTIEEHQKKLIESSKMASLGEMAAGVAHEINNPLAIIQGRSALILRSLGASEADFEINKEKIKASADTIVQTTARISKIIKGLRSFSRNAESDPLTPVSLKQIFKESFELCEEKLKRSELELILTPFEDVIIGARATQIAQVIVNLLSNSIDAVSELEQRWIKFEVSEHSEKISIQVTDSGPGIPHSIVQRMMEPFFTTKELTKGTGLGLSISKGIIEDHGGTFQYNPFSKNTSFIITLPKKAPTEESKAS